MNIKYLISKAIKKMHIPSIRDSFIDKTSKVCTGSHLINVKVGRYTYIGNYCTIIDAQIDNFCSIADNCAIGGASHPLDWVSTSPVFHSGKNILRKNFANHQHVTTQRTNIGSDVWIGSNCLIKSGVKIGTGSVIGMGSILTKDVGEYEIWAGNPAHIIRKRFEDDTIEKILLTRWWEWPEEKIADQAGIFNDISTFVKTTGEEKF